MKIVVTGATGFVGGTLTRRLAADGVNVHVLLRPSSNPHRLHNLPVEWHMGDIAEPRSLRGLFDGADYVIHAAGLLGAAGISDAEYRQINEAGVQHVLAEIERSGADPRILHLSSAGVLGPFEGQPPDPPPDESFPYAPSNGYERSKVGGERIALHYAQAGLRVIIARPEFLYGPDDLHVLGLFRVIQQERFFYVGNGRNTCHPTYIEDAVNGLLRCLKSGVPGEIYNIAGPRPVTFRELAETIATAVDAQPPRLQFPRSLVWLGAAGMEVLGGFIGKSPPLSRTGVDFFSENRRSTFQKAAADLGYIPRVDLQEGVQKTVAWYREHNLLS